MPVLPPEALARRCNPACFSFATTAELEASAGAFGQERAQAALEFGIGVAREGYNVFVMGPAGSGKRTLVRRLLAAHAARAPAPQDWVYVNNFAEPQRPLAIGLPAGRGSALRADMQNLVEELRSVKKMPESERGPGRILLALDTGTPLGPALEAAAALAASLQAELAALFVEDERLPRLAELPLAREIGFGSATLQSFGLPEMELALRVQAEQARRALGGLAQRLALAWTLDVIRGEMLTVSLGRLGPGDVLVLARARHGRLPFEARSRDAPRARQAGPVVVLYDDPDSSARALGIGHALARESRTGLVVLIPAADEDSFRNQRARVERWLAERRGAARCVRLAESDGPELARVARRLKASALVWPGQVAAGDRAPLARVLEELACPIVLTQ